MAWGDVWDAVGWRDVSFCGAGVMWGDVVVM